jgi:uncharacterized membrane protein YraQ (UPF0718 family)
VTSLLDAGSRTPTARQERSAVPRYALLVLLVIAAVALLWAKWYPYTLRVDKLTGSHHWSGSSILRTGNVRPGSPPSWHAATSFTRAYVKAIWMALVAALLISAALQALVPRTWLTSLLTRRRDWSSAAVGGLLSTPSMMCTCCSAPVVSTLRRSGAPMAGAVAYWLGNPLLNPAVLVFLGLVAPWQWTVTRLVVGLGVVVLGSALVARVASGPVPEHLAAAAAEEPCRLADAPRRFVAALGRLVLWVIPEYLLVVVAIGAFRGWLFPLGGSVASWGVLAVLLAAVVGTLVVIPTAGEIPILQGLALAGFGAGPLGALLLTLPAVSLPAMVLVGRALGWRATLATSGVAAVGGVVGGALLWVLT